MYIRRRHDAEYKDDHGNDAIPLSDLISEETNNATKHDPEHSKEEPLKRSSNRHLENKD